MDKNALMWFLGGLIALAKGLIIVLFNKLTTLETTMIGIDKRLVVVETNFKWMLSVMEDLPKKAAKVLHSPHTPELDALLEMFHDGIPMTRVQMGRMQEILQVMEDNLSIEKGVRLHASILLSYVNCKSACPVIKIKD